MKNSSEETYYIEPNFDIYVVDVNQDQAEDEVYLAELIKGDTYTCPIMAKSELPTKNEPTKEENKKARTFLFDITKDDIIFDRLYKDKQIKLSEKHKLPSLEQIEGKKYCKWHNARSHTTNSCLVLRHVLHDAIESGRIIFESKKKMAVDENPFPKPIDINMVTPNLDKLGFPRFKLVIKNGENEPRPSAFDRLKRKAVINEVVNLCAVCHKEIDNVIERSYEQPICLANETSFHPFGGQVRPFYGKRYGSFQDENGLENKEEEGTEALKEEFSTDEYVEKSRFESRKKDEDDDDAGQLITIQFSTIPPIVATNYRLANEFKNDEHDEEMMEEDQEVVCTFEGEGGTSVVNQLAHNNDEEDDDGMTDIEEEIDLEIERRIRRVLYNNLLKQLYQEGNPVVGLLGKPSRRSFDYYVLNGMPTRKKRVPQIEKYGLPPVIMHPPTGWKEPSMDIV
ncbi:putative retroelement [Abeliophyllum distichum]|uniref:Retroelement n=1 Tax=Abeliophyllum distichum TaxID=126358 RepID=A0ABD1SAQ4_9LAMI